MPVKVSVVVPVYNPGRYIEECVGSLLRQSLPSDEYEAIFVDDGSTDGTGERLDALAAEHANVTAIHIPNSGWPGRPRNVGMDAATGKYVYFVDNDDWLEPQALERLYDYAERNGSDVVIGREVGHGKGVPRELFRRNVPDASLERDPLLVLLTPHKLFRRDFLREHDIRFPEGRRRLEDHVFVMKAFFNARRISILSEYPCYHWVRREDAGNATDRYADPRGYYDNVREVLDIVDQHIEPGPLRDRFYAHWYRSKALHRLRGALWAGSPSPHALNVYTEIRRLARERFGPGVVATLPMKFRVLARSVEADRIDLVQAQARAERGMQVVADVHAIEWTDWRLRLSLSAVLAYADGSPVRLARRDGRVAWWPPEPLASDPAIGEAALDVTDELGSASVSVVVRNRDTRLEYDVVATIRDGVGAASAAGGTVAYEADAEIDLRTVATGSALGVGTWDLFVNLQACGWSAVKRLPVVGRRTPPPELVAEPYATQYGNLSVSVKRPEPEPAAAAAKPRAERRRPSLLARARRRARRVVLDGAWRIAPTPLREMAKRAAVRLGARRPKS